LSHAEIYRGDPRSRNRISCCYEFLTAKGVVLGAFSNRYVSVDAVGETWFLFQSEFTMNLIFPRIVTGLAALFASVLMTACGAHSTNQSTETFTVYEDAPKMSLLDLGAPGNSLGNVYISLLRYSQSAAVRSQVR